MKRLFLIVLFSSFFLIVKAQQQEEITIGEPVTEKPPSLHDTTAYWQVEREPEYFGGSVKLYDFINKNLQVGKDKGTVMISFIVEKNGRLSHIRAAKHLTPYTDAEAVRVVAKMPKWRPGAMMNIPVRTSYTLPIYFK